MAGSFCAAIDLDGHRANRSVLGDPLEGELVGRVGWDRYVELKGSAAVGVINVEPVEERHIPVEAREMDPRMGGGSGVKGLLFSGRGSQAGSKGE